MNAKEYLNYFGGRGNMYYDFDWINFHSDRYYNARIFIDESEIFADKTNNILKPQYPHLDNDYIQHILINKILES